MYVTVSFVIDLKWTIINFQAVLPFSYSDDIFPWPLFPKGQNEHGLGKRS